MWGSDYPHDEGTDPYTREHLRQLFHDSDPVELQQILAGSAANLYGFDLDALAPLAAKVGPTVAELATAAHRAAREPERSPAEGRPPLVARSRRSGAGVEEPAQQTEPSARS